MGLPNEILKQYWGYDSFRSNQGEIINAVLTNKDTLALLPTGGGKSVCYQVPGMIKEGVCLVISPLIALMKDQVENLKSRGIDAVAITSGMTHREVDIAFENACNGKYKFLYLSPERLKTELFRARVHRMNISFIAIDEAHCISQWGYDFRPAYLEIGTLREELPDKTILALTATATDQVTVDIQEKLGFKEPNVLKASFKRDNLSYVVFKEENKLNRLLNIVQKVPGSGVVYLNSRKGTREIAEYLFKNGISADFYHAGLNHEQRNLKQDNWKNNKTRVICATNAFGMGIDKSDVRFVVHLNVPASLEAYFQEAGRAGRDGLKSYAILLYEDSELEELQNRIQLNFPEIDTIRRIYKALGNFYQIAIGSALGRSFPFDISEFCNRYSYNPITVFNAIKFLEKEEYVGLDDVAYLPSRFKVTIPHHEIYTFKISHKRYASFIDLLLRSYSGYFEDYVSLSETTLARKVKTSRFKIVKALEYLAHLKVIDYIPQSEVPQLTYLKERLNDSTLPISRALHGGLKKQAESRAESIKKYLQETSVCRSQLLLDYFDESHSEKCGICDVCIEEQKQLTDQKFAQIQQKIIDLLTTNPLSKEELFSNVSKIEVKHWQKVVDFLIQEKQVLISNDQIYSLS